MKPRVYVETTIVSYLAAWPSRDLITSAHQQITHEWWRKRRAGFELYVSELVIQEAGLGDKDAISRRSELIQKLPVLATTDPATALAEELFNRLRLPARAAADALHVALAVVHGIDFLITWNCVHIANARLRGVIDSLAYQRGYKPPVVCTPEELMEEWADVDR